MAATLSGITAARGRDDADGVRHGVERLLLLYAIAFGYGGIPMIYMGDELGQGDDHEYLDDPLRAPDSRWRHRPAFADALAADRHEVATIAGMVWSGMRRLVVARRRCPALHGAGTTLTIPSGHPHVFAWQRRHPRLGAVLGVANVTGEVARLGPQLFSALGEAGVDLLAPDDLDLTHLAGFQVRWLTADATYGTEPVPPPIPG